MKKQNKVEKTVESNFLMSLLFLILSLGVSLTVFIKYKPTNSFNYKIPETVIAEKTAPTKDKLAKTPVLAEHKPEKRSTHYDAVTSNDHDSEDPAMVAHSSQSGGNSKDQVQKALHFVNENQPDEARKVLEKVLAENPDNEEALTQLALIHILDYKDDNTAQPLLEKALKINPDNKTALAELVEIYSDREDGAGVKYLQALYDKNPDNNNLALGIGQVLIENNPKAAIQYLEKGGEKAYTDLGEAYSLSGDHSKALETHQRQAEAIAAKIQNGEGGEYMKDELNRVNMNIVGDLMAAGQREEAQKVFAQMRGNMPQAEAEALMESAGLLDSAPRMQTKNE